MEPCGTPQGTVEETDETFPVLTDTTLFQIC